MKNKFTLYFLFLFLFFIDVKIMSQINNKSELSYVEIEKKIVSVQNDQAKLWNLINLYINKSKKEKNSEALLYAYRFASNYSIYPTNLKYADSALIVGKKSQSKKLLTDAYLNRGNIFMYEEKYNKALDEILTANKYATELGDDYIIHKTMYFIAQNKIYLGLYKEANEELKYCIEYFKKNLNHDILGKDYQLYYLYSLMSFIDSNTKIGKQKQNKILLKEAFNFINKNNNLEIYRPYFISSEGTDLYYSKNYKKAIIKLSEAIRLYNDQWPHITEIYYLGMSNWKLEKRGVAIKYLEEIDKEYNKTKKLDPQFRSAYELLIRYNDSIGNKDKQLEYINKLMALDRNYEKNYKYLFSKINKEYDTHKLINEKNRIENSLKTQRTIISTILLLTILATLFFWNRYNSLQKIYKEKFEKIISEVPSRSKNKQIEKIVNEIDVTEDVISNSELNINFPKPKNSFDLEYYNKIPGLNPLIVENILNQLEHFEKENKFLDNQVSKTLLSEILNTNPTYLSRIINVYKGKNVSIYINDLRLEYIIDLMKNDAKYLNMDVKELAYLSGFTNTQNFSDNFQRKFEIKPSYFIKMMKENIKTHS